ncbi:MAG: hypothetical protein IPM60_11165 [Rhodospirillales bacterium]|nr:hypothetical protein [Rhodospirillales bacterium]
MDLALVDLALVDLALVDLALVDPVGRPERPEQRTCSPATVTAAVRDVLDFAFSPSR